MLRDPPLSGADGTEVTEAPRSTDHLVFHAQALFAIMIHKKAGSAITVGGIHVPIPEINRF
jgi:hypothetical protein